MGPFKHLHDHDTAGDEDVNEVDTFAKAGETAGAAVGTGVQTVREGVTRARKQLAKQVSERGTVGRAARDAGASAQTALADRWGTLQQRFPERWETAQELLADRMAVPRRELAARLEPTARELAARIEPAPPAPPRRRRRWPWVLLLLASLGSAVAAAVLAQRPQPVGPGAMPAQQQDPTEQHRNGVVSAEEQPSWRE